MAFLAKGLIGPAVIGVSTILLPIVFREWRNNTYIQAMKWAALSAFPWLTIWPIALYIRSSELFELWFWTNNIGRFFGFSVPELGAASKPGFWWRTYPWFLFPTWLFAALVFWLQGRRAFAKPAIQIGLTLGFVLAVVLGASASARASYSLPMVVILAIMGAGAFHDAPPFIDRGLGFLGLAAGTSGIVFFWLVWALIVLGEGARLHWLERWLPLDFVMPISGVMVTAAGCLSVGAIAFFAMNWKRPLRGVSIWCSSLIIIWGLASTLWLPWIDAAKSYRAMFEDMQLALPEDITCVASSGLGESERAMLDYVLSIKTKREEIGINAHCNVLIVQNQAPQPFPSRYGMVLAWFGNRPGDRREQFSLFVAEEETQL